MIKLYPVLVSNSVSKNIIPGILKSVERFALIYKLDDLARSARRSAGISLTKVGKRVVMKESDEEIAAFLANEILHEQTGPQRYGGGTKSGSTMADLARQRAEEREKARGKVSGQRLQPPPGGLNQRQRDLWYRWNRERDEERMERAKARGKRMGARFEKPPKGLSAREKDLWYRWRQAQDEEAIAAARERGRAAGTPADATIAIGQMDMKSIMLEPTWMKIDRVTKYGQKFTSVLGVKAVSVPIRSDATLAQLLTFDKNVGRLMHLILKLGRKMSGLLYRIYSRTIEKMIDPDPKAISGDPYKDIVLKRTIISETNVDDVFLVLNQADFADDFALDAKGIRKLMSLGWQSFCIADDVNRRLTFCMSEFRGMCNTLPYTMIYQSLDQAKVFEDLEDLRRSSTSLFRTKIPMKKVIGESLAQQKLEEFGADLFGPLTEPEQQILNEIQYIDESFASTAKKLLKSPKMFLMRFFKGNIKVPEMTFDRAMKIGSKTDPKFKQAVSLAKRVLSNSVKVPLDENRLNWLAMTVVIRAKTMPGKDLIVKTRDVLMSVIPMLRRGIKKAQQSTMNIPPQHRVEAVFGLVATFMLVTALAFIYTWTMIASLKIKPHVEPVVKTFVDIVTTAYKHIKFYVSGEAMGPKEVSSFYSKLIKDHNLDLKSLTQPMRDSIKDTFDKASDKVGKDWDEFAGFFKREFDLSMSEAGVLFLLIIVGLGAARWVMRPPK